MAGDWRNSFRAAETRREAGSGEPEGRPCARREHCAGARQVIGQDGYAYLEPASGPASFCQADQSIIRRVIADVPRIRDVLAKFSGIKVAGDRLGRSPSGPSVPLRLDVDEISRLMFDAVMAWHERVATSARLDTAATADWRSQSAGSRAARAPADPRAGIDPRARASAALHATCPVCATPVRPGADELALWQGWSAHADCKDWLTAPRCPRPDFGKTCQVLAAHLSVLLSLEPDVMTRPARTLAALLACGEDPDSYRTARGGQWTSYAGGATAGNEFLRLDYLARACMGLPRAPVTRLLGVECANEMCSQRALRLADPPQHDGDRAYYSQCMACRHLMTDDEYALWTDRQWRWFEPRMTTAQIARSGDLSEAMVTRLAASTRSARSRALLGEPAVA